MCVVLFTDWWGKVLYQATGDTFVVSDRFGDGVKKISAADKFEHQVNVLDCFELFHQADDVRVSAEAHDRDFILDHVFLDRQSC